jgi:hypothetical protein
LVLSVVDHDRPLGSVVMAFVHEVEAPREPTSLIEHTFRPARVPAVPAPLGRRRRRAPHETETA